MVQAMANNGGLPKQYQAVEYIGSDGSQYIDTLVNGGSDIAIDIVMSDNKGGWILGSQKSASASRFVLYCNNNAQFAFKVNSNIGQNYKCDNVAQHHFILSNTKCVMDNYTYSINSGAWADTLPLFLFAMNNNGTYQTGASFKIHKCNIFSDTTLVRQFVPCYDKQSLEIGMYDTISRTFFTNSGTGTFTKGNDIKL